ncbi:Zinc-finger homeodomain protein 3 [Heracleum sosnowskyi]|uniref:Zinc-finger homeodomain protein 3 n=1 Tax=Heracleum sosnowskyi TaxID=360622 RepID=A0AAD8H3J6_9APIA|nr:Zinc-finger homeodomain protein 3 [Heracleum sosnowskyi]
MEMTNQDVEMPDPINSSYGHGHIIHHNPISPLQNQIVPIPMSQITSNEDPMPLTKVVKYKECLKNHAAAMGGNAIDGCGEFMASGEEGTPEAYTCSVCNCHRNFHRKETEGETKHPISSYDYYHRKLILGHPFGTPSFVPSRATQPHHMLMSSYNMMMGSTLPSESDEQEDGGEKNMHGCGYVARVPSHMVKKRFRTKFSQEQKEKMIHFAEKGGWKIQNLEESMVQQFCQEVGVKRKVLKVWMHNNKHHLSKINPTTSTSTSTPTV